MVDLGGDVRALLAQAQRVALKSGTQTTSGHIVLAMLESSDEPGRLLEAHGARTASLYESLKSVDAEASNAVELMLERARLIASHAGARKARSLHLLLAAIRTPRSEAYRSLAALGVKVEGLRMALEQSLGVPQRPVAKPLVEAARAEAAAPLPRTLIDWETQKRLGNAPPVSSAPPAKPRAAPNVRIARPAARERTRVLEKHTGVEHEADAGFGDLGSQSFHQLDGLQFQVRGAVPPG